MSTVKLVGILNVTPDSFSDGGEFIDPNKALAHARQLVKEGASLIDVGAESTRPHATPLSTDQEWDRLKDILLVLVREFPGRISLDTYHPETVRRAAKIGPVIVNDVTGFNNPDMIKTASEQGLRCIVSHLPKRFGQDIQLAHTDTLVDSIEQVKNELLEKREEMIYQGIAAEDIILDPGIGFGKTAELNWKLLEFARQVPGIEVMIGYSRKRFLGEGRMHIEPNLLAGKIAIAAGTRYLRVHDVAAHVSLLA